MTTNDKYIKKYLLCVLVQSKFLIYQFISVVVFETINLLIAAMKFFYFQFPSVFLAQQKLQAVSSFLFIPCLRDKNIQMDDMALCKNTFLHLPTWCDAWQSVCAHMRSQIQRQRVILLLRNIVQFWLHWASYHVNVLTLYVALDSGSGRMLGAGGLTGVEGNQQESTALVEQQAGRWLPGLVLPITQKMDGVSLLPVKSDSRIILHTSS